MRNLKRALSLALASAMLLGMMVVGASAADYGDTNDITHDEAVEVLSGLGVVGGDTTGNYNPTATLTRAEFCVMMANMLTGGSFDSTLFSGASTPFTDISGHWGQAYIAYCYSVGVIAGTSATTFDPDNTLTAAQASAILLSALGYNQNGEFGANGQFELNVTRWAQQAGLYKDLSVSANSGISRDDTAQLVFNALVNTTPVGYSSLAESYYTTGTGALNGVVYSGNQLDPDQSGTTTDEKTHYTYTLGYTNFTLQKDANTANDAFGRPASTWVHGSAKKEIGTYPDTPEASYTVEVTYETLYDLLGSTVLNKLYRAQNPTTAQVIIDGETAEELYIGSAISYIRDTDDGLAHTADADANEFTGRGTLTEVYLDDEDNITIVVVNSYLANVESDYDDDDESVDIVIYGCDAAESATLDLEDFAGIVTYEADDKVIVTVADGEVQSVYAATVVSDVAATAYSSSSVTAGGTRYSLNKMADEVVTSYTISDSAVTYNLYLDTYGYVLGSEGYENSSVTNYVYISAYEANSSVVSNTSGYTARAYFTDGSVEIIDVRDTGAAESWDGDVSNHNTWYSYTRNSAGRYTLTALSGTDYSQTNSTATEVNSSHLTLVSGVRANSSTIFIFLDDDGDVDYTRTGIRNVDFTMASGSGKILVNGSYAAAVIISNSKAATTSGDYIYILGTGSTVGAKENSYDDVNDVTYYTFDAIVDGRKTTINALDNSLTVGLYDAEYDYDGLYLVEGISGDVITTNVTDEVDFVATLGTVSYSNGTLTLAANSAYVLADSYTLLTVDGKTVTSRTTSRLTSLTATGADYAAGSAIVLLNDDGEATLVMVFQAAETN